MKSRVDKKEYSLWMFHFFPDAFVERSGDSFLGWGLCQEKHFTK